MMVEWNSSFDCLPSASDKYLVAKHVFDDYQGDPCYDVKIGFYSASEGLWYLDSNDYIGSVYQAHLEFVNRDVCSYISHWAEIPSPPKDDRC